MGQYLGIENRKDNSPDGYVQGKEHKKECGKQNTCREGIVMNEGVQVVLLGMVPATKVKEYLNYSDLAGNEMIEDAIKLAIDFYGGTNV